MKTNDMMSRRENSILWFLVIITLFVTDNFLTTVYIDSRIGTFANGFIVGLSILLVLFSVFSKKGRIQLDYKMVSVILADVAILVSCYVNDSNIPAAILKCSLFLLAIFFYRRYSIEQFAEKYLVIIDIILIFTLVLNVMYVLGMDLSFLPRIESTKGVIYYWGILGNVHANSRYSFLRISGIWMEPGVCAAYIIVGLLFELYLPEKTNYKRLTLYIVSLLLTFSTTGYICFILLLLAKLFEVQNKNIQQKFLIALLIVVTVALSITSETINDMIIGKILGQEESFKDRYFSIMGNILAISRSPILGLGTIKSSEVIKNYMVSQGVIRSFSNLNTILAYFSVFGLVPGLLFTGELVRFPSKFTGIHISKIFLLGSFILILASSNYLYSMLFTLIFFMGREEYIEKND